MNIEYFIVDVFAKKKYQGNQLAVFLDQDNHLNQQQMQLAASEIGFAETTFITNHGDQDNRFSVRIFDPVQEIPFAGHPTLGTSFVIANNILNTKPAKIILDLPVGEIPVRITYSNHGISQLIMKQVPPEFGDPYEVKELAKVFDLKEGDFSSTCSPTWVTTGLPYIIINLNSIEAIQKARINFKEGVEFLKIHGLIKNSDDEEKTTSFFLFTTQAIEQENQLHGRMFWYDGSSFVEDSATGSANGCLLAYLLKNEVLGNGKLAVSVEQGFEINRPSYIYLEGHKMGTGYELKVGGQCHTIASGTWFFD